MLKEIFDKQDNIFWKHTLMFFFCYKLSRTKHELPDRIMHKIVQNCKGITLGSFSNDHGDPEDNAL